MDNIDLVKSNGTLKFFQAVSVLTKKLDKQLLAYGRVANLQNIEASLIFFNTSPHNVISNLFKLFQQNIPKVANFNGRTKITKVDENRAI